MADKASFFLTYLFTILTLLLTASRMAYSYKASGKSSENIEDTMASTLLKKNGHHKPYRVCYYTTWARYRRAPANMQPQDVDENLCTHLIMAFAWITSDGRLALHSEWEDQYVIKGLVSKTASNPDLKILVSVGGQNFGSEPFRRVSATASSRQKFVNSTLAFIRKWGLHGLDIDWEYPGWSDSEKFTYLLRDLNDAFLESLPDMNGEKHLLTIAIPAVRDRLIGYDIPTISDYVDIVHLMAYNFHSPRENKTGHNAPMYSADSNNMVEAAKLLVELGMPRRKIAIGLPTFGLSFQLADHSNPVLGAPAGSGEPAKYTRTNGCYAYYEVCEFLRNDQTVAVWDYQCSVPFAYNENTWISYDDTFSLRKKVQWLISEGYGGVMIWELGMDDFNGQLCRDDGNASAIVTFPLLRAINDAMGLEATKTKHTPSLNAGVDKIEHADSVKAESPEAKKMEGDIEDEGPVSEIDSENIKLDDQCDYVKAKRKDCHHFTTCYRGIQYEFECPDGTVFGAERGECVWPHEAPECGPPKSNNTVAMPTKPKTVGNAVKKSKTAAATPTIIPCMTVTEQPMTTIRRTTTKPKSAATRKAKTKKPMTTTTTPSELTETEEETGEDEEETEEETTTIKFSTTVKPVKSKNKGRRRE